MIPLSKFSAATAALLALATASCEIPEGAFEHTDSDDDGKLEVKELEVALTETVHVTGDTNRDGTLTLEEWTAVYPKADKDDFNKYDTDGTPGLSLEETTIALDDLGTFDILIAKIDTNKDGVIDKEEAAVFYDALQAADGDNDIQKLDNLLN
jgi:Ca2+-binding EF-hand superfamily protein